MQKIQLNIGKDRPPVSDRRSPVPSSDWTVIGILSIKFRSWSLVQVGKFFLKFKYIFEREKYKKKFIQFDRDWSVLILVTKSGDRTGIEKPPILDIDLDTDQSRTDHNRSKLIKPTNPSLTKHARCAFCTRSIGNRIYSHKNLSCSIK